MTIDNLEIIKNKSRLYQTNLTYLPINIRISNYLYLGKNKNYLKKIFLKLLSPIKLSHLKRSQIDKIFNFHFVNKIKNLCIDKAHEKSCLVMQTNNNNKDGKEC